MTGSEPIADPLVQAMTLTALVIGFAVTALLLALVFGVYRVRRSVDLDELSREETLAAEAAEARELAHDVLHVIDASNPDAVRVRLQRFYDRFQRKVFR